MHQVKKFLVGRQFFVIFVVFLIAQITSFPGIPSDFLGMPPIIVTLLTKTGLPGVSLVLTIGQLVSQIYVEEYTIEFLNLYGCEFVIRLSLFTEWIGVCNFSWFLYHMSSFLCCRSVRRAQKQINAEDLESAKKSLENYLDTKKTVTRQNLTNISGIYLESMKEISEPMSPTALHRGSDYVPVSAEFDAETPLTIFDYIKYLWSTFATVGSVVIIMYGISREVYVLPTPVGATYILFFLVLCILFYLEGLMIAIVETQYWDKETWKDVYPRAYALHEIVNRPNNVKRFIIGRQFCTVLTGFLLAQICTFEGWHAGNVDPIAFYIIVQSGLVGVLVTLAFGQLMPELLAQEFPLRFMNLPGSYSIGCISLFFDKVGVGHAAWAIYYTSKNLCCTGHGVHRNSSSTEENDSDSNDKIIKVRSAEILAASPTATSVSVSTK